MCLWLGPSSSVSIASEVHLTDKYKKVIKAGDDELGKKPIAVVEHFMQQIAVDVFIKQLGLLQDSGASTETIA
eukprot:12498381-Ditylum_brightwellii.AAC.1